MYKYFLVFLFMLTSCGLKTFYLIEPPYNAETANPADGTLVSTPYLTNEFIFTARNLTTSTFISPGTDIYYRIYASQEDLQIDAKRINDANDEDSNSGFKQLESLGYKRLTSSLGGENTLINSAGGRIRVRLADSNNDASIEVSGVFIGKPIRWNGHYFNFDSTYNSEDDDYAIPVESDEDYKAGSESGYMYVNAYAVSSGMDTTTFVAVQSELLSLGFTAHELK